MRTVSIQHAKANLSRLVDQAAQGEAFVITKAGRPLVKVVPIDRPTAAQMRRLGFMAGQFSVPEGFDRMGGEEIDALFDMNK
ncbi:type II toxin-antitoxin system prevent-host-death family antitoxin [Mesorhizobium sp. M2E.F.Ca.ET.209.01.1.1]|jgi:prevent-host-death family protein|uniref:type II toxin-antitoxin system Phd/YefM family antitoxin n=1 Tax=Mesorhizobium sp. M2E.F.Ca.ET.209.01.1.1 TaxID=2500526 RepID=UPI000FDBF7F4|nr:type II toxin-antitoxin system prevent-host-death family antitoxin [Mesorhizobium sp. M2E.F.Ca.ET.209.01.1.1]RWL49947.1 MAG: type II toxin-antitoxin system prevent-host-death family antitoxin [Mesorhizobium sp.]TGS18858.1 type II toxin-antitoxin system prevent-host-death family antitoxin [Mesorhizobium sp. M2E.F.Ca.ET.209.01.1.1]